MVAKSIKGGSAVGLVNYLAGRGKHNEHTDQRVIAADIETVMLVDNSGDLTKKAVRVQLGNVLDAPARQWGRSATLNVWHIPIALPPGERLDDERWRQIAGKFLKELGVTEHRWALVKHGDTKDGNDHVHLVIQRTHPDNGKLLSISHDYPRITKAIAKIARAERLTELAEQQRFLPARERRHDLPRRPAVRRERVRAKAAAAREAGHSLETVGLVERVSYHPHSRTYDTGHQLTELRRGVAIADAERPDVWFHGRDVDVDVAQLHPVPNPMRPLYANLDERDLRQTEGLTDEPWTDQLLAQPETHSTVTETSGRADALRQERAEILTEVAIERLRAGIADPEQLGEFNVTQALYERVKAYHDACSQYNAELRELVFEAIEDPRPQWEKDNDAMRGPHRAGNSGPDAGIDPGRGR